VRFAPKALGGRFGLAPDQGHSPLDPELTLKLTACGGQVFSGGRFAPKALGGRFGLAPDQEQSPWT